MLRRLAVAALCILTTAVLAPLVPALASSSSHQVFVSPGGGGDGSSAGSPLGLGAALAAGSPVAGGGTVWLAGGTYAGCFAVDVSGAPGVPVVVSARQFVRSAARNLLQSLAI